MMKNFLFSFSLIFLLASCGGNQKEETVQKPAADTMVQAPPPEIDLSQVFDLKKSVELQIATVHGNGLGTFRRLELEIANQKDQIIEISLPAGLYFKNPDENAQDLLTSIDNGTIKLEPREIRKITVPTVCTEVRKKVPAELKGWPLVPDYEGGLDEVLKFYGTHQEGINLWLKKKNPGKFSQEEDRLLFEQVIVWLSRDAQYDDIARMISQDVYGNDIKKAKSWLDEIYDDAKNLAAIINSGDTEKLKEWLKEAVKNILPDQKQINKTRKRVEDAIRDIRGN